ncbi:hypothetical protein DYH10_02920 [Candidatus Saccharibacteria bacterium CPR2]|nr:hypothetical protein [Candidatus Saccharibacteria bacterium CPR2]
MEGIMAKRKGENFVDLVITEAQPTIKRLHSTYRVCTISTKINGQKVINLQLPQSVQQKIFQAYTNGKKVRIFA